MVFKCETFNILFSFKDEDLGRFSKLISVPLKVFDDMITEMINN